MTYSEKLQDARWQEKRLLIFQRDEFSCQCCGKKKDEGVNLQVHHSYYERSKLPWEYEDWSLKTVCSDCHKVIQDQMEKGNRILAMSGASCFMAEALDYIPEEDLSRAVNSFCSNLRVLVQIANSTSKSTQEI